eukprot:CAMPEP_0184966450 /NCGR_PEP_ID=MMETSP1098-20130426/114_1 /TAXON_ID=89044 /ORGANISM="Spumella elongata, Strain CCAP 955/1" /LENGTH=148 /DNA_ID=CAMNT_0027487721 /DNA_START=36 /DNA_END=482 /DNA_ORIENTATION=+
MDRGLEKETRRSAEVISSSSWPYLETDFNRDLVALLTFFLSFLALFGVSKIVSSCTAGAGALTSSVCSFSTGEVWMVSFLDFFALFFVEAGAGASSATTSIASVTATVVTAGVDTGDTTEGVTLIEKFTSCTSCSDSSASSAASITAT